MELKQQKKPEYFFEGPFRFVKPYQHTYQTHCKKRWLGKQLFPTLCKQFLAYDDKYFLQAIKSQRIKINNKPVEPTYKLCNNDLLTHNTLRQQPPILNLPVKIIHEDDEVLVVEKPPSMIVHTGGGYHYNTLIKILKYQMGYDDLFVVHRLDRMTSGILILAKIKEKATQFHQQNANQIIKKMYYARVNGKIQWVQLKVQIPLICLSHKEGIWGVYQPQKQQEEPKHDLNSKQFDKPVDQLQRVQKKQEEAQKNQKVVKKMTNHRQKPQLIKQSTTIFKLVWYDQKSDSSLLQCYPITGRTHQIRVHLQHIGHPILNDVGYGGRFVGNKIINIAKLVNKQHHQAGTFQKEQEKIEINQTKEKHMEKQDQDEVEERITKKIKLNNGYEACVKFPIQMWDYKGKPWEIYLHSFRYNLQGKQYQCFKPHWSKL